MHFLQHVHDLKQEHIRTGDQSNSNRSPQSKRNFLPVLKIVHGHMHAQQHQHFTQPAVCVTIFSTGGKFHPVLNLHSYTLLLQSPVLMHSCLKAVQYHPTETQQSLLTAYTMCCHNRRTKSLPHILHTGIPCMFAFNHNQVCVTEMSTVIGNTCSNVN